MIKRVKLECEGEVNCFFEVERADGSTRRYWSCDGGSPESEDEGPDDLTDDESILLMGMWSDTNLDEEERVFSSWERSTTGFVKIREWTEE